MVNLPTPSPASVLVVAVSLVLVGARTFTIVNNCPIPYMDLVTSQQGYGLIQGNGGTRTIDVEANWGGTIYSTGKGGSYQDGTNTTRAGFKVSVDWMVCIVT